MVAYLGGIKSAVLGPVYSFFTPLFFLAFLIGLTAIIQESYTAQYRTELSKSVESFNDLLPENQRLDINLDITLSRNEQITTLNKLLHKIFARLKS